MDRLGLRADYETCEKLIRKTGKELERLELKLRKLTGRERPNTASVTRHILRKITALQSTLFETGHTKTTYRTLVQAPSPKTAQTEFTLDLVMFIRDEFRGISGKNRNVLVGAATAAAGLFTAAELKVDKAYGLDRIPMRIQRAEEHYKKNYRKAGIERVFLHIGKRSRKSASATIEPSNQNKAADQPIKS
jgi:hypothetical protein